MFNYLVLPLVNLQNLIIQLHIQYIKMDEEKQEDK